MSLSQQTRARMTGIIAEYRTNWQAAGIEAALVKASQQHPDDDLLVLALAIAAARNPNARGPAAMLTTDLDRPVAVTPKPTRRATDPECPEHGGTIRDDMGRYVCCRTAVTADRVAAPLRVGTSKPPADLRSRIASDIEQRRDKETGRV